jgi:D-alanyl-D-alanine carboxypeptidase (penicillin-binding protein 5/6)
MAIAMSVSPAHATSITITGQAAVLMETRTGKILWQRNKDLSLAPASTTKILTALVVIERSKASDVVTVPVEATVATGGTAHLRAGERLSVEQLLYGMLLGSANDAAIALANHASGSVARFVNLMNKEARSLGALRSSFRNPTGLPQKGHMTTATISPLSPGRRWQILDYARSSPPGFTRGEAPSGKARLKTPTCC